MAASSESLHGVVSSDLYRRLELTSNLDPRVCRRPRILSVLSTLLERVVTKNERQEQQRSSSSSSSAPHLDVFHGLRAPNISIDKYLERIFKYASCSSSCFVVAYVYIDRFIQQKPSLPITSLNVHRLLVTSVMVAAKFLDDAYYNNAYYAKVGGVSTQEMNRLELEFLFHLNFRLQVTVSVFESYCARLEREVACLAVERPPLLQLQLQVGCGLDEGSSAAPEKQRLPAVRCSIAGL